MEQLRPGDRVVLQFGRRVTVERVDRYDDRFVVRWWRDAERGEPGHPGGKNRVDDVNGAFDGRYFGSMMPVEAGYCWRVDRAA